MSTGESENGNVFKKIAVAVAFSPRIEAIIAEARNLKNHFNAAFVFIHAGKSTLQNEEYLKKLLHRFELDNPEDKVVWREGEPVDVILSVCEEENVDLLVAGALEKESLIKYFLGGVARQLSRKCKCSMLMLSEPSLHAGPMKRLVVEGTDHAKTRDTINVAIEWAKAYRAEEVDIIQETDLGKMALTRSEELKEGEATEIKEQLLKEEDAKLETILSCNDCGNLNVKTERLEGKPGYMISKYARENDANLLVLNSPDRKHNLIDRVFPHDIEFALADLPCNLLIVNQNKEDE